MNVNRRLNKKTRIGNIIGYKYPYSTSSDRDIAESFADANIVLKIIARKGTKLLYVDAIYPIGQIEFIFPSRSYLKIINKYNVRDMTYFVCELNQQKLTYRHIDLKSDLSFMLSFIESRLTVILKNITMDDVQRLDVLHNHNNSEGCELIIYNSENNTKLAHKYDDFIRYICPIKIHVRYEFKFYKTYIDVKGVDMEDDIFEDLGYYWVPL